MIRPPRSVFPDWMLQLTMQMQSVLILAARGPDGIAKRHPTKAAVRCYRAHVLKSAYYGRMMTSQDQDTEFMGLNAFAPPTSWLLACDDYFAHVDELPHHYHMHLLHGAEILAHHYPDDPQLGAHEQPRKKWWQFYLRGCDDGHLRPETDERLERRLSDFSQRFWSDEILAQPER